jgi:hypothetical protein
MSLVGRFKCLMVCCNKFSCSNEDCSPGRSIRCLIIRYVSGGEFDIRRS